MQRNLRAVVEDKISVGLSLEAIGEELTQMERLLYEASDFHFTKGGALGRKTEHGMKDYKPIWWATDPEARAWIIKTLEAGERIHPTVFANKETFMEWLRWHQFLNCKNKFCIEAGGKPDPAEFGDGEDDVWKYVVKCGSEMNHEPTYDANSPTSVSQLSELQSLPMGVLEDLEENPESDEEEDIDKWDLFAESRSMPPRDYYNIVAFTSNREPEGKIAADARRSTFHEIGIGLEDCILPFQVAQLRASLKSNRAEDMELITEWSDENMEAHLAEVASDIILNRKSIDEEAFRKTMARERGRWMGRRRRELANNLYLTSSQWRQIDTKLSTAWEAAQALWGWMQSPEGKRQRRQESNQTRDDLIQKMREDTDQRSSLKFFARYAKNLNEVGILWSGDYEQVRRVGSQLWKAYGRRS